MSLFQVEYLWVLKGGKWCSNVKEMHGKLRRDACLNSSKIGDIFPTMHTVTAGGTCWYGTISFKVSELLVSPKQGGLIYGVILFTCW